MYDEVTATQTLHHTHARLDPAYKKGQRMAAAEELVLTVARVAEAASFSVTGAYTKDWPVALSNTQVGLYVRMPGRRGVYVVRQDPGTVEVGFDPIHLERVRVGYDATADAMVPTGAYESEYPDALQVVVERLNHYLHLVNDAEGETT